MLTRLTVDSIFLYIERLVAEFYKFPFIISEYIVIFHQILQHILYVFF